MIKNDSYLSMYSKSRENSNLFKRLDPYHLVLLVQFMVLLPHVKNLPIWLSVYAVVVIISQLKLIKQKIPLKKRGWEYVKGIGFIAGITGLWFTYRTAFGLDIGVSFLLLCLVSKLLELYARRDGYVVLSLSLFVLAGAFLMSQSLGTTILVMFGVTAIFYVMIAHNDSIEDSHDVEMTERDTSSEEQPKKTASQERLRALGVVSLLAIPLMIVLFIFFPRLPPLWTINLSGAGAKTGMSNSMSPGDFASLSKSTELAFRVLFKDNVVPPKKDLYWRGMTFSKFDGTTWTPSGITKKYAKIGVGTGNIWIDDAIKILDKNNPKKAVYSFQQTKNNTYKVIMQPTNQQWLFGLSMPYSQNREVVLTREYNIESKEVVSKQFSYEVTQYPQILRDIELTYMLKKDTLQLPSTGNEKSRIFAKNLYTQVSSNPEAYVSKVLQWIQKEDFYYTLQPPKLNKNRIDSFLFDTKQGFCEHYASSFTFLMRAVGIPARVVVGYQGGERGNDGKSWEVRQMDAHAWTEVWLEGKGWQRVDPTAAIAPERVNNGMSQLAQTQGVALFGTGAGAQLSYQQFKMMQRMRKAMDHMSFVWQRDVVGFDQDTQKNSLLKWFNVKNQYQQVLVMFVVFVSMVGMIVAIQFWRKRKRWHRVDIPLVQLSNKLKKAGLEKYDHEGVLDWLHRLGVATQQEETTQQIAQTYRRLRYSRDKVTNKMSLNTLTEQIKSFKLPKQ